MIIYGVAILAFCFVIGQLIGEFLGKAIKVDANVGGVGFAMLLLIILSDWFNKKGFLDRSTENGLMFWNQMYIPIVVAMSATQNVRVAVSSGFIAVLAGLVPIVICAITIPFLANLSKNTQLD
jgi:malonate transporter MadL subunit|nr:malonate transporter subunit MadL [uncultured Emticicia sp.]